jgi:hypothetical protein
VESFYKSTLYPTWHWPETFGFAPCRLGERMRRQQPGSVLEVFQRPCSSAPAPAPLGGGSAPRWRQRPSRLISMPEGLRG